MSVQEIPNPRKVPINGDASATGCCNSNSHNKSTGVRAEMRSVIDQLAGTLPAAEQKA
jgi:hypothetical protein